MDPFFGHRSVIANIQQPKPKRKIEQPKPKRKIEDSMVAFRNKYPYADFSKFYEDVDDNNRVGVFINAGSLGSVSVTDPEFLKSKEARWLTANKPKPYKWPKIWSTGGDVPSYHGKVDLKYSINNFRVYVNEKYYFMSNLPVISASWHEGKTCTVNKHCDIRNVPLDYKKEPYFAMICGAYVSSYLCGLSLLNIVGDVNPVIKSVIKYHFYYQIRKFMKTPNLLDRYNFFFIKGHIPWKQYYSVRKTPEANGNMYDFYGFIENSKFDYNYFISKKSNGLTRIGQELLQESIESFVYSILGAQAKTRWAIVNKGAKSLQTQQVFRKIVEDTIIQNDITVVISNMRTAIADTNVLLNLAISPGVILLPSSLIILEKPIPGYSNIIKTATSTMRFGSNSKVNYVGIPKPKKVQNTNATEHRRKVQNTNTTEYSRKVHPIAQNHESLNEVQPKKVHQTEDTNTTEDTSQNRVIKYREAPNDDTELVSVLGLSSLATLLIVKYVI